MAVMCRFHNSESLVPLNQNPGARIMKLRCHAQKTLMSWRQNSDSNASNSFCYGIKTLVPLHGSAVTPKCHNSWVQMHPIASIECCGTRHSNVIAHKWHGIRGLWPPCCGHLSNCSACLAKWQVKSDKNEKRRENNKNGKERIGANINTKIKLN